MKKTIGISILCLLVLSLAVLSGCSSEKEQASIGTQNQGLTSTTDKSTVDTSDKDFDQAIAVSEDDVTIGEMI